MFGSLHLKFEHLIFDLPESYWGRAGRWVAVPLRYLYALTRDFLRGELGLRAMSLVYSTLFALVPTIAVSFAILKAFGYHHQLEPALNEFLLPLGQQGPALVAQIMQFVENAQGSIIGTIGFVFLIYTVVSMIQQIEEALNFTWHVDRPRSLGRRVSEYLVVLIVGPLISVLALTLLASVESGEVIAKLSGLAQPPPTVRSHYAPHVLIIALFWFLYAYMPNTRVRLGTSFVGALLAGAAWTAVGALFTRIVVYSVRTAIIYAGFAVVLLFLLWLYVSWLIVLLGAQLSFYVQHPEHLRTGHGVIPMTPALRERIALSAMFLIGERFLDNGPRWCMDDLAERLAIPATVLGELISALEAHGLVLTADDDTIAPARDLGSVVLADILEAIRHDVPNPRCPQPLAVPLADEAARAADAALRAAMSGKTLRELIRGPH
ncbi:MAG TPA: YihY/virulence factor BrkB family protein [Steroidobacteraceae bacterium]|nr:YihY/virulence factor BrkB family protein [Steroidobacteraceae bacterium]